MSKINLRDLYPDFYKADCIIEVPEEVLGVFVEHERREAAYGGVMALNTKAWQSYQWSNTDNRSYRQQ